MIYDPWLVSGPAPASEHPSHIYVPYGALVAGGVVGYKWGVVPGLLTFVGLYVLVPVVLIAAIYGLAGKGRGE